MLILHVTSSQLCLYLLNVYLFTYTFSHAHTEAHTRTHKYNQHTRGMVTTRHRSLVERGGRKAFVKDPAKLLDYFLRSNESNINHRDHLGPNSVLLNNSDVCAFSFCVR